MSQVITKPLSDSERGKLSRSQISRSEGLYTVINARTHEWTEKQMQTILDGMERTSDTVPGVVGENYCFALMRGEEPVGFFFLFPMPDNYCEVGIRLWGCSLFQVRLAVLSSMATLFNVYEGALARVYSNNKSVKRLLQRAAFGLIEIRKEESTGRTIEVYGVKREQFFRVIDKTDKPERGE